MKRWVRWWLLLALVLASFFAAWKVLRPYEWGADVGARCEIQGVNLRIDRSFFWVEPFVTVNPGMQHDLTKPVYLLTATGRKLEPADSTFASFDGKETREIWFKFWLDSKEIAGPLDLYLNDGKLRVKTQTTVPHKAKYYTSNSW